MSRDLINVDGEDVMVREDTAKAYRGVNWAIWSILGFILIAGILFVIFSFTAAADGDLKTPAEIQDPGKR